MKPILILIALLSSALTAAGDRPASFRDWGMRCPDRGPCILEQRVYVEGNDETPLLQVAFRAAGDDGRLLVAILVPLGVLLPPGIELAVDGGASRRIPFHHCRAEGCLALLELTDGLRGELERGREARLRYVLTDGRSLGLPLSLLGITAGLRALDAAGNQ